MKKSTIALLDQMMTGHDIHIAESTDIQDIPDDERDEAFGYILSVCRGIHQEREAQSFAMDEARQREEQKAQRFSELAMAVLPTVLGLIKKMPDLPKNPYFCLHCGATFDTNFERDAHLQTHARKSAEG